MTKTTDKTVVETFETPMAVLPGAAVSAHHFRGMALSDAAAIGTLSAEHQPANHGMPTILQQIAMYRRLQKMRAQS